MAFNIQGIITATAHVHRAAVGDPCPTCHEGHLQVVQTKIVNAYRVQYIGCRKCNHRPPDNKIAKPLNAPTE